MRSVVPGLNGEEVLATRSAAKLLILTFLGVFVEIFFCVWGLIHVKALWITPFVLGAYHAGYILAHLPALNTDTGSSHPPSVMAMLVMAMGTLLSSWPIVTLSILVFSTGLQVLRRSLKKYTLVSSQQKNITKALAMAAGSAGALPTPWLPVILALGGVVLAIVGCGVPDSPSQRVYTDVTVRSDLLWFELFHHAHYFAYCYTFWALLDPAVLPLVGPLFIIGWLGYFGLERLLKERTRLYSSTLLALGHVVCAAALWGMLVYKPAPAILGCWFITGIGGGVAYMLGNVPNGGDRELYEDLGHVLGCLGTALTIGSTGRVEPSLVLGIVFALSATMLVIRPAFSAYRWRTQA